MSAFSRLGENTQAKKVLKTSLDFKLAICRTDVGIAKDKYEQDLRVGLERAQRDHEYRSQEFASTVTPRQLNDMYAKQVASIRQQCQDERDAALLAIRARVHDIEEALHHEHAIKQHELDKKIYPAVSDDAARRMGQRLASIGSYDELMQVYNNAKLAEDVEAAVWLEQNASPVVAELSKLAPALHGQWEYDWRALVDAARTERGGPEVAEMKAEQHEVDATSVYVNSFWTQKQAQDLADLIHTKVEYVPMGPGEAQGSAA
jgi:hypothetical protein